MNHSRRVARVAPSSAWLLALALVASLTGCGDTSHRALRYKAERLMWLADRKETEARLLDERPDSTTLLSLRDPYLDIARKVTIPKVDPSASKGDRETARDVMRLVGNAELQAARLAVQANRPELAIETMKRVQAMAGDDTLMQRRADFFLVGTLRQYKRYDEAVALMHSMLERYPVEGTFEDQDAILAIPEAIVRLYRDLNDSTSANVALNDAGAYYRRLLEKPKTPFLEAQIRARLIRVELEQGDWTAGLRDVAILRRSAAASPELKSLEPEIHYSEAKLHMMHTGKEKPNESVALLDQVAKDFPRSPFAGRALMDAATLLEGLGRKPEALARYRQVTTAYDNMPDIAPAAFFRRAMLEDQLGDWESAKNLLEGIPVRYPESLAALEAPVAIANRYARVGQMDAAKQAIRRAISTYQKLVEQDTTSSFTPLYRWSMLKCQALLGDTAGVYATIDEMSRKDLAHPITGSALMLAARVAHQANRDVLARRYLERYLANYPKSVMIPDVKRELARITQASSKPNKPKPGT